MKKRVLSLLAALCLALSLLPTAAWAAEDEEVDDATTSGAISEITSSGEVDGNNITVSSSSLTWCAKDTSVGRNSDGWWIGVKITAPSSVTSETVSKVTYSNSSTGDLNKNFGSNNDGTDTNGAYFINCWVLVNQDYLATALVGGTNIVYTYRFDWTGDNTVDQTFTITVDPANITLSKDDKTYCQTVEGKMTTSATDSVASIGDVSFTSLEAAVAAAQSGNTIKLLGDVTLTGTLYISTALTLDLNGHTISYSDACNAISTDKDLTVKDSSSEKTGKIDAKASPVTIDSSEFILESGTLTSSDDYGVFVYNGGSATVNDGTITSKYAALSGNNTTGNMNFYVNGGTLTAKQGPAIYMPGQVYMTITDGTLNGGIVARMGIITISGGTIDNSNTGNTDTIEAYWNYSGNVWYSNAVTLYPGSYAGSGDSGNDLTLNISGGTLTSSVTGGSALAVYVGAAYASTITMNVSGGTFTGASGTKAVTVLDLKTTAVSADSSHDTDGTATPTVGGYSPNSADNTLPTKFITGGTFSAEPDEGYIADGYQVTETTDGGFQVSKKPSSSSSGSSSSSSSTTTTTTTNEDGSVTTTTTNNRTGTVTETTTELDGTVTTVVTTKDGTVTTTETDADGSTTTAVENPDGSSSLEVTQADGSTASVSTDAEGNTQIQVVLSDEAVAGAQESGEPVTLPIPDLEAAQTTQEAAPVEITLPEDAGAVEIQIPLTETTPGTVAVIVAEDGTEEIVSTTQLTEEGISLTLESSATVKVVDNAKEFVDVPGHWAEDAIDYTSAREIFHGTSETTFTPEAAATRGTLAVVLHNLERNPDYTFDDSFTDLQEDAWYTDGILWAASQGIVTGYASGAYGPDDPITREQLVTMLYRYASLRDYNISDSAALSDFVDAGQVSDYAETAMAWAVGTGLIVGMGSGALAPQSPATRAQVATVFARFCQNVIR